MILDDLDRHLPVAGSIDRAAIPLGLFVGWCANLQLLAPNFARVHEDLILRVRFREITGSELLVGACAGTLRADHLDAEGQRFAGMYLPRLLDDVREVFACEPYDIKDNWASYDRIAPVFTRELMATRQPRPPATPPVRGKVLGSQDASWWRRRR